MSDVSDVTDITESGDLELGPTGAYAHPRYINDMNPTTKFHPSELPANAEAMRNFPRHLIDPNQVTESPYGDSSVERRLERSLKTWKDRAGEILREEMGRITGSTPAAVEASTEQDLGPTGVPGGVAAVGDVPITGAVPPADEPPAEVPAGETEAATDAPSETETPTEVPAETTGATEAPADGAPAS